MSLDTRTPRFQKHVSFKFADCSWALSAEGALSQRFNLPVTPLGRVLTDAGRAVARHRATVM